MSTIEVNSIVKKFGDFTAVDGVSFKVEAGEIFGLLGPNGAGKSTLIRMLVTLLPPTSGSASINGFDVVKKADDVRRSIGVIPQAMTSDLELTVEENLVIFAKLYDIPSGERDPRIQESLSLMDLQDAGRRMVREYSGGMIRRLEIAQSMLHRPRVLFLDEPTVGLDPIARNAVWDHLRQLREQFGTTIFLTTHNMVEADEVCDRVGFLAHGTIALTGVPDDLKRRFGSRTLDAAVSVGAAVERRSYPMDGIGTNAEFLALLTAGRIVSMHTLEASLDDVFIRATSGSGEAPR